MLQLLLFSVIGFSGQQAKRIHWVVIERPLNKDSEGMSDFQIYQCLGSEINTSKYGFLTWWTEEASRSFWPSPLPPKKLKLLFSSLQKKLQFLSQRNWSSSIWLRSRITKKKNCFLFPPCYPIIYFRKRRPRCDYTWADVFISVMTVSKDYLNLKENYLPVNLCLPIQSFSLAIVNCPSIECLFSSIL